MALHLNSPLIIYVVTFSFTNRFFGDKFNIQQIMFWVIFILHSSFMHYEVPLPKTRWIFSTEGFLITPFSVMIAAIFFAGVTSKAGLKTLTPSGAVLLPNPLVTSSGERSSIGISFPDFILKSKVETGAAQ